jgi:hypothetical protein
MSSKKRRRAAGEDADGGAGEAVGVDVAATIEIKECHLATISKDPKTDLTTDSTLGLKCTSVSCASKCIPNASSNYLPRLPGQELCALCILVDYACSFARFNSLGCMNPLNSPASATSTSKPAKFKKLVHPFSHLEIVDTPHGSFPLFDKRRFAWKKGRVVCL